MLKKRMRILNITCLSLMLAGCNPVSAEEFVPESERHVVVSDSAKPLVAAARQRLKALVVYDPKYVGIEYPNGDVPCLLYTSPSPRDQRGSRMPSSA